MKPLQLTLLLLISGSFAPAQRAPEWSRVYTFDESIIEMNTARVVLGGDIGRITFRWIFDQAEPLPGKANSKYKTRLETVEFRCSDKLYRYYEVKFLDSSGKILDSELMRSPYTWRHLEPGSVITSISLPACELIAREFDPETTRTIAEEQIESEKVNKFALSVRQTLAQSLDFKQVVEKFLVADFIGRYLNDADRNWFDNVGPDVTSKAGHDDLQRFYVASMNAAYLTSLYVIGKTPPDDDPTDNEQIPEEKMIPADVYRLIDADPYTRKYKRAPGSGYDYLAEKIESVDQMLMYAALLEKIAGLMRRHVINSRSQSSKLYADMIRDSEPSPTVCAEACLGLPKGTEVFDLTLPALHLQFAKIQGAFKIISATVASP
jgi:hypothetical protein